MKITSSSEPQLAQLLYSARLETVIDVPIKFQNKLAPNLSEGTANGSRRDRQVTAAAQMGLRLPTKTAGKCRSIFISCRA